MNHWVVQTQLIRFRLSDWTLFSLPLRLQTRSLALGEPISSSADPEPPAEALHSECHGFMLRAWPLNRELPTLALAGGYLRYVPLQYRHCFIDMSGDFDAYRQKFSSKTRSTLARKVRKFADHCGGSIHWTCHSTPEELTRFMPMARAVSRLTYQERLLDAGLPADDGFLGSVMKAAADDRIRAFLLFDGERPVSYLFCPVKDGIVEYAYLGYDPEYQRLSAGTVLQWLALERLFAERRFRYFDFTEGESEHKLLFATDTRRCANVIFLRRTLRHVLILRGHRLLDAFSTGVGNLLERWRLKAAVRKLLRRAG